jgi:hypothetical protein
VDAATAVAAVAAAEAVTVGEVEVMVTHDLICVKV